MSSETTTITIEEAGEGVPMSGELVGSWDDGEPVLWRVIDQHGCHVDTSGSSYGGGNRWTYTAVRVEDHDVAGEIDLDADDLGLRRVHIHIG